MVRVTRNELLDALKEYGKAAARRPAGKNWFTLQELAEQATPPTTVAALKYKIMTAQKRGVQVEMAPGTQLDADGNARKAIFYRLKGTP